MKAAATLLLLLALGLTACGGGGGERGEDFYQAYRATEDERSVAEDRLHKAFSDIAVAAERRDRASTLAAVERGQKAIAEIERLLALELEAARGLAQIEALAKDGAQLERGLVTTRKGLRLFARELDIATRDPFLDQKANAREVTRLARTGAYLAADGEMRIRRADRALALALGLEPRFDAALDAASKK